jgi:hypothetical protein
MQVDQPFKYYILVLILISSFIAQDIEKEPYIVARGQLNI